MDTEFKRYILITAAFKVVSYGHFDTPKEAENWWYPQHVNQQLGFVCLYDIDNDEVIEYNTLYLTKENITGYVKDMFFDLDIEPREWKFESKYQTG